MTVDDALIDAGVTCAADRQGLPDRRALPLIPAVQRMFADRFGAGKIEWGDQFESIAQGLALIGQAEDAAAWVVH